jgi:CheY-like chemotaxis protein
MRKRLPKDDPKLLGLLDNAVQGAQRGTALTKRMLAFARRQELKQEPVDIPNLVRGMTELLRRSLGSAVALETRFPLVLPPVLADGGQLEMALLNLTVNARDAMMPNGGNIVISAREQNVQPGEVGLAPGSYVRLAVSDTGSGMDETTLRRATEPFFTTKEPGKGTGLGLSMVHGLAEQFGGRFDMQSRPGEGTVAELWLPVAAKATQPAEAPHRRDPDAEMALPLVILAVDDDPLVLTNTAAMLEDLGHTCFAVSSAAEALEILNNDDTIDLVITDQIMPRMTGLQLADAIRRQWQIPVLLVTGFAEIEPGDAGTVPKLAKPFTQAELAAQIAHMAIRSRNGGQILKFRGHGTE